MITEDRPESQPDSSTPKKSSTERRPKVWGGRTFRFNLDNFRPGRDFSLQRFSIVEASLLLVVALLASRGLGIIRQTIFNDLFGTGAAANAYYAASNLPDTLFNLIAGGALTHAFVPVFFSYEKDHGSKEAWRLASLVFNVLLVALTFLIILGEIFTPYLVSHFIVPGYSAANQALTTSLTRIVLLQPLILGLGTIATGILNSKRQFWLTALSVAIYNLGLIGGLLVTLVVPKVGIYGPTYGILVAAFLQVAVQIPGLWKQGVRYSFVLNIRHPGLKEVMRLLIPNALGVGVGSIGFIMNTAFASYLHDGASLAAIHNANMLYQLPIALISQAVGQALLPYLVAQAASRRFVRLRYTALKVMGASLVLTIPAAILLAVLGGPLIRLLFQHGAFTKHSSSLTNLALIGFVVGLPGTAAAELISRGFYALKDTKTPLFMDILTLGVRYGLTVFLLNLFINNKLIILAIPLSTSLAATLQAVLVAIILFWRLNRAAKNDKGMVRLQQRRMRKQIQVQERHTLEENASAILERAAQEVLLVSPAVVAVDALFEGGVQPDLLVEEEANPSASVEVASDEKEPKKEEKE